MCSLLYSILITDKLFQLASYQKTVQLLFAKRTEINFIANKEMWPQKALALAWIQEGDLKSIMFYKLFFSFFKFHFKYRTLPPAKEKKKKETKCVFRS